MSVLDYLVIALYAVLMLAIGQFYARRTQTTEDYLLGGRRMSPLMVGLSLFATLASTLTYLAYPGEMIKNGPMIFAQLLSLPVAAVIVGWGLIPYIMALPVSSAYELLEKRLGQTGRLLGSGMFLALRLFWMASILYATADKVLMTLLGLSPSWTPWLCVALGVITLIYTAEGGLRAVVVTDALQSLIMFAGAIVIIVLVTRNMGGVAEWWPDHWYGHWQEAVFWSGPEVRISFIGAFVNMLVWMVCTAGSDQMAIQRYLATRDAATARRSFIINLVANVIISVLLGLAGLALLGYFLAHPGELEQGATVFSAADKLLPQYVVTDLPAGLAGLVIAAMLSAAMSSLSSGMNSSCAVILTDFVKPWQRVEPTQKRQVQMARIAAVAVGILAVLLSTVVGSLAENLLDLCVKLVNLLTAPLFVLFFLALFVPWATPLGAVAATVASVGVASVIAFFGNLVGLSMMWSGLGALLTGVVVGSLISLVPIGRGHGTDGK